MVLENFCAKGCHKDHLDGVGKSLGARLWGRGLLLTTRAAVTTVDNREQEAGFAEPFILTLLEHRVGGDRTEHL